jgi:serine phosphatase RsbU (regulator of sigma subunit)
MSSDQRVSIRTKLLLLAGIPLIGAIALAAMIVSDATEQARRARTLGSMESLAELSQAIGALADEIESERALRALAMGQASDGAAKVTLNRAQLDARSAATERARHGLEDFLRDRTSGALPRRLAEPLRTGLEHASKFDAIRSKPLETATYDELEPYGATVEELVHASAGLNELTDDGDVLRAMTCLVASLELKERASREHAVLAYAFAAGDFAPGTYRQFVNLLTEEDAYSSDLRTYATPELLAIYTKEAESEAPLEDYRKRALQSSTGALEGDANAWFKTGNDRVESLRRVEMGLHDRLRSLMVAKLKRSRNGVTASATLVGVVLFVGLAFAWVVSRQLSRRVLALRGAAERIAAGDLAVRVDVAGNDELEALGTAFNHMASEVEQARVELQQKARMSRELEIASQVQRLLLPRAPSHEQFDICGRMSPADEVGGDFYDVLVDRESDALWITMGDVSSHGLGAGLVMLMTQAAFATQFRAGRTQSPDEVLRAVNATIRENVVDRMSDNKYVTAQLLTHAGSGVFRCAGGHLALIVYRAATKKCERLDVPGPWLGILPTLRSVPVTDVALAPGDVLCLYTDGLTEARDVNGALFDEAGLLGRLEAHLNKTTDLETVTGAVFADVEQFATEQDDDRTLLLVRRR